MSVIGSNILAGASGQGGGYNLDKSLRFRNSANAYLNRTPSSTSNQTTWTWSGWLKRGIISPSSGYQQSLFAGMAATATKDNWTKISFLSDSTFRVGSRNTTDAFAFITTQVFRDPSAWYHFVVAIDTTQATDTNRVKIYVNGSQITSFSTSTYPSQNYTVPYVNASGANNFIGTYLDNVYEYLDGYLTEVNFIDGQALTPSSFGATSATTGVWQPKKYAGTYGTNGFYLPFTDNSTTTTLGNDFSGNGNNWTTNNISLTAGSTYDSMTDVPTLTSATASNFCVVNPLNNTAGYVTVSAGNLNVSDGAADKMAFGTMALPTTGKWYFEYLVTTAGAATQVGLGDNTVAQSSGSGHTGGNFKFGAGGSWSNNDIAGVAIDMDAGTGTLYKNNSSYLSLTGLTGTTWYPCVYINDASGSFNFGQRPFAYTPPTGFVALNTFNLPTPTIGATASTQANKYMDATLYTGNGSSRSIVNSGGMQPDLVWIKHRSSAENHNIYDVLRGAGYRLESNSTSSETYYSDRLTSFNSDGFSLGTGYNNTNGTTYVAWQWDAGSSTVTNTSGSISSQVRANTSAGFSVVTYTGNGSAGATVGHGLGVAPRMLIIKAKDGSGYSWKVYHGSIGSSYHLELESTGGLQGGIWNSTNPSSTVFTLGTNAGVNENGKNYVAYVFADVSGYSKLGSYTGNGSSDGAFIYTGFRPKYVMLRSTSSLREWFIIDTSRSTYNVANTYLRANTSAAEGTDTVNDILSNGFKLRNGDSAFNGSGETYIYMAFAENPFKYSLAR